MIPPIQVVDSAVSGLPQGASVGPGMLQAAADFLILFGLAMGKRMTTPEPEAAVSSDPIDMPDVSGSRKGPTIPQSYLESSGEKDSMKIGIDSATALLTAALRTPMGINVASPDTNPPQPPFIKGGGPGVSGTGREDFPTNDPKLVEPSFELGVIVPPTDATTRLPLEIDQRLTMSLSSEETGASLVPSESVVTRGALYAAAPPADPEVQPLCADGAPVAVQVGVSRSPRIRPFSRLRGEEVFVDIPRLRVGDVHSLSSLLPFDREKVKMRGDIVTDNPRLSGQPTVPFRGVEGSVLIGQVDGRSNSDRVLDAAPRSSATQLSRTHTAQGEGLILRPFSDLRIVAHPADAGVAILLNGEPPLPPIVADGANGRVQFLDLNGDVATHAQPDPPAERTISGMVSDITLSTTVMPRTDREPTVVSGRSSAGDRNAILAAEAGEMQRNAGPADNNRYAERVEGLPPMATTEEGPVGTATVRSTETAEQASPPRRSAAVIATLIEPMTDTEPEPLGGDDLSRGIRLEQAEGRRNAISRDMKNETPQEPPQDRWSPDSKDGGHRPDGPVSSFDDGRQFGSDLAGATAPRGESLRSDGSAPSFRPRVVVEQVAEQIATAARISLRQDGESVHLRLHPRTLGDLVIEVSWKEGGIIAAIKAQSHVTGELLAGDLGRLRIALEEQGFPVSDLGVQVGLDFRQWNSAGNGSHASPAVGYAAGTIPWHDRRPALSAVAEIGSDSLIDITV